MNRITVIGGGTGSFTLLQGLKKYPCEISVIFSTADNGGSSGILRQDLKIIPPGDARQCLIALAKDNQTLVDFLSYRFSEGSFRGHNLGNLLLAALVEMTGNFTHALGKMRELLKIKDEIIPVTLRPTELKARLSNGTIIRGEHSLDEPRHDGRLRINKLYLSSCQVNPQALEAIRKSDLIIFGPGDLYTSLLPNLLVDKIVPAIRNSKAIKIYVGNLMTKWGQTNNFRAQDFVQVLEEYLGENILDYVIFNSQKPSLRILKKYAQQKEYFVEPPSNSFSLNTKIIVAPLVSRQVYQKKPGDKLVRSLIRHDSDKLTRLIMNQCRKKNFLSLRTIILDFDHTLFDANKLRNNLIKTLRKLGIKKELFLRSYKKFIKGDREYTYYYNPHQHIKFLAQEAALPQKLIHEGFREVIDKSSQFLFPDSLWFLGKLKAQNSYLVLLSRGWPPYQANKISKSGIKKFFDKILIIDEDKNGVLKKIIKKSGEIIFINDNWQEIERVKKEYPQILCLAKSRKINKNLEVPTFGSFKSLYKYLYN